MLDWEVPLAGCNTEHPNYVKPRYLNMPTAYKEVIKWNFITKKCRQLGRFDHVMNQWTVLMDCRGCRIERDEEYITQGRSELDERSGRSDKRTRSR